MSLRTSPSSGHSPRQSPDLGVAEHRLLALLHEDAVISSASSTGPATDSKMRMSCSEALQELAAVAGHHRAGHVDHSSLDVAARRASSVR